MTTEERDAEEPPRYFTQRRYRDKIQEYFTSINNLDESDWDDILASAQSMLELSKPFFLNDVPDETDEVAEMEARSDKGLRARI